MRTTFLVGALAVAVMLAGCGSSNKSGGGSTATTVNPGPNPTSSDPGPNPTNNGPVTIEGTLQLTGHCLTLKRPQGPLDLRFKGYSAKGTALLDDTGTVVAHDKNKIAVAGHMGTTKNACGTRFDVTSLVTVFNG